MNEKELGEALLQWDANRESLAKDPRDLVAAVLEHDRRRVRRWNCVAGCLWVLALAGILVIFITGGFAFPRIAQLLHQGHALGNDGKNAAFMALAKITAMSIVVTSASMASLVFAGLGTLVLVRTTRQATLRQANAALVEITEQIKQLRSAQRGS